MRPSAARRSSTEHRVGATPRARRAVRPISRRTGTADGRRRRFDPITQGTTPACITTPAHRTRLPPGRDNLPLAGASAALAFGSADCADPDVLVQADFDESGWVTLLAISELIEGRGAAFSALP